MTTARSRLTHRGTAALCGFLLVVVGIGAFLALRPSAAGCTVTVGSRTVELDRSEAEQVSAAVARVVRRSGSDANAVEAVRADSDLRPADAAAVASALTGRTRAALSCSYGGAGDAASPALGPDGLTARAERVRNDLAARFGQLPLGGFAPGGVHTGHMVGSAHYEGRAIDVFFRPITSADKRHGWALAQYLVANAARLQLSTVIFDGEIWTADHAGEGWRTYRVSHAGKSLATIRILEHRDHVHVDVPR
ncbi:MAG: hypothetical protein JWP74_1599 [Marmoricola sp.]|nr:hypothetical protein [Marmoricola sp.]